MLRDTLGDADNEGDLGSNGLLNTGSGDRGRDEDGRGGGSSLLDSVGDGCEDGLAQVNLASLLGVGTTDDVGAILDGLLSVEGALLASETLVDDLGLVVDPQVHDCRSVCGACRRVLLARSGAHSRREGLSEALHCVEKRRGEEEGFGGEVVRW